ncbi:hypothetical protein BCF74_10980 [Knoellia remsis]|uniref:Secretion/DNA translocation related CpaE-like protein n=1 Tax=Knoellia remsis TaxID=407159 RepID=A0A2T0UNJ6_9MICO|nr:hypothetical protein [Knoellia remsis]PRY59490.1 hypothetical protein BCF74_10980 [Knoellia remsis]
MTSSKTPVVIVHGASGGLGASTWAAAVARRLSVHLGECVLVDAHVGGGGLDMTCGTEHVPGLRWPDLARLRGTTSAERLVAALPRGEVPLLSASGTGPQVAESVVRDVLGSLAGAVPVVVDAVPGTPLAEWMLQQLDPAAVHVVAGLRARQLADAQAVTAGLVGAGVGLVTRGARGLTEDLLDVVADIAPHLAHLRDDSRVVRDGERGEWPGLRGPLRDTADGVVVDLVEWLDGRAA